MVHVDSENDLYENVTELMRPQKEIEQDIVAVTSAYDEIKQVTHIVCHYLEGKLSVQLDIELDSNQTISQAKVFVNQLKLDIKKIPDITNISNFPTVINDDTLALFFKLTNIEIKAIQNHTKKAYKKIN